MNVRAQSIHSRRGAGNRRPLSVEFFLAALLIGIVLIFGGASRLHALRLMTVEIASVVLITWSVWRLIEGYGSRYLTFPSAILAGIITVPLLQLTPIPYEIWSQLPGRQSAAAVAQLAGVGSAWRPYTLTPHETWKSIVALLPVAAMFLVTSTLGVRERRLLTVIILGFAAINLLFGVGQIVGGGESPLYLYEISNRGQAVGLFANRNHYAILLVVMLPLAALWVRGTRGHNANHLLVIVGALLVFVIVVIGVVMGRSRAGFLLLAPALTGAVAIIWNAAGRKAPSKLVLISGTVAALATGVALIFGFGPLLSRFGGDQLQDMRFLGLPTIWREALAQLPFGSGIGSFEPVYQSVEPVRLIGGEFLNHAHNDYMETWLETGFLGAGVFAAFMLWWLPSAWRAFKMPGSYGDLARAGVIITGVLLIHSAVDYPLRTPALATLFAFGCGLLIAPPEPRTSETSANARLEAA